MKFARMSKGLMLGVALLLASSAFAGSAGTKADLELNNPVMVNGTKLKAGEYKVQWEGSGANVQVSILKGNTVVAKAQAHEVQLRSASSNTAAVTRQNGDGPSTLEGLRFQGKKFALDLSDSTEGMNAGSSR